MAVLGESTIAHLATIAHIFGYVADEHWHAVLILHGDVFYVFDTLHKAFTAYETRHVILFYISATRVLIVATQSLIHLTERHLAGIELFGRHSYLILFDATTEGVDLHHARYHRHLSFHYPVLYGAQFLWRVFGSVVRYERILVYLAQSSGDRSHLRRTESSGYFLLNLFEFLLHQLTRAVGAHVVLEYHRDHG